MLQHNNLYADENAETLENLIMNSGQAVLCIRFALQNCVDSGYIINCGYKMHSRYKMHCGHKIHSGYIIDSG